MKQYALRSLTGGMYFLICSLHLYSQPVASFIIQYPHPSCAPATIKFINTSTGDSLKYAWKFGIDSTSVSSEKNPSFTYTQCGTFSVMLFVTDLSGITSSDTQQVIIPCAPQAGFYTSDSTECAPGFFCLTNSSKNASTYSWSVFKNATNYFAGTNVNPCFALTDTGSYSVRLIASESSGCSDTLTRRDYLRVSNVHASFQTSADSGCSPLLIHFTDLSVADADSIINWSWNFGDPASGSLDFSSLQNPSHTYDSSGTHIVSLTVTTQSHCSDDFSSSILVFSTPDANFATSNNANCVGEAIQFSDQSSSEDPIARWHWNFHDASSGDSTSSLQNPVHVFKIPGAYRVILNIITSKECTDTISKLITVFDLPIADAGSDQTICLFDSVQLHATGGISYSWFPSKFLSDSTIADPFAFPPATTLFFVTVTDLNGCSAKDSVRVNVRPAPFIDAGNDTLICFGTTANLHASGAASYHWSPSATLSNDSIANPVASPLTTTTYTVTTTDSNGCSGKDSVTVIVVPLPDVSIVGLKNDLCEGDTTILLQGNPPGGIFSGPGVAGNFFDPSSLAAGGPYEITYYYVDSIGCAGTDTVHVTIHSLPTVSIKSNNPTVCANTDSVTFILNPIGGDLFGKGIVGNVLIPSIAGAGVDTITYVFTDSLGCSGRDTTLVTILPSPFIDAGADTSICFGSTANLHASGADSYRWSPSATLSNDSIANPVASPLITTTYFVTTTDSTGCIGKDSVTVFVVPIPDVHIVGLKKDLCEGDTAILLQGIPPGGIFSGPGVNGNIFDPSSLAVGGPYTIRYFYSDSIGCSSSDSIDVTIHPLPIASITSSESVVCANSNALGFTVIPEGGVVFGKGIVNNELIPSLAGAGIDTITYIFTDTFGCSGSDTIQITILPLPNIDAGIDTSICAGDSIQLSASGALNYHWSPQNFVSNDSISNPIAFPDSSTTFIVTTFDSLTGCSNSDSVTVIVYAIPQAGAGPNASVCIGDSILLHATGGSFYSWSPSIGLSDTSIANPFAFPTTTTTYTVTVRNGRTCVGIDSIIVSVNPLPVIDAGRDTSICPHDSLQLFATGGVSYQWSPANSLSNPSSSDPFAFPTQATTYFVKGTDANGCSNTDSIIISFLPAPNISAGSDVAICIGDSVMLHATGGISYHWSPSSSLSDPNISNPYASPISTTSYIVSGNDGGTCNGYDTVIVTVNPLPNANAGADQFFCKGKSVQLYASGGVSYSWLPVNGLSDPAIGDPIANPTSSITYTVTVTDTNRCRAQDSVHLELQPPLNAFAGGDTVICEDGAATLHAGGGIIYEWFPSNLLNDPTNANPIATPHTTTTFTVTVSDGICYTDTFHVKVQIDPPPSVQAGPDVTISAGDNYPIPASGTQGTYQWAPSDGLSCVDCLNPIASPLQTTTYTITVTDSAGCKSSDDIIINVGCENAVFVPNAFTPNGNGKNDVLYVRAPGISGLHFFRVYDRWGKIIFETNDVSIGWDGTFNGKPMAPGVFLYSLEAICGNGNLIQKQGNVTLIR